jgi:flagellar basal body P-ring protein FlgI
MRWLIVIFISTFTQLQAELLQNLATVQDGLDMTNAETISDDYIRFTLALPSYTTVAQAKLAIENWLGPEMVQIESDSMFLVQAPRDANARVEFIAALMQLDIDVPVDQQTR